jgi:hypothetical protein
MSRIRDKAAYQKLTALLRRQRRGVTVADMAAGTGLGIETVRELIPRAADEYRGRLEVTESGEILYSFPRGFTSRYRGFRAVIGRWAEKIKRGVLVFSAWFFKVWIMVMLVGYFVLFLLIALAALALSVAASFSNSNNRSRRSGGGGVYLVSNILSLIIRFWFYSELLKPRYYGSPAKRARPAGKPLYKAVFSFVFGDGDPNAGWPDREKKGVLAYIQANRGVISLPEFMILTGLKPDKAEDAITAYCAEFGGLPEATEEGTVVYRFDPLLLKTGGSSVPGSAPLKGFKTFSSNPGSVNRWFALINGVNLAFGGYFLYHALNFGAVFNQPQAGAGSYLFAAAYSLFYQFIADPLPLITVGLGFVPLIFSFLFWIIPALRRAVIKKDNENIRLENLRKTGYGRIWDRPREVRPEDLHPQNGAGASAFPFGSGEWRDLPAAQDRIIKEIGSYAVPEVAIDDQGRTVYSFTELDREKKALERYRASVDPAASALGKTVFDSGA